LAYLASGGIPLRPGVARLLREARQNGLRLAIATTTTPENVTELLRASLGPDFAQFFEVIGAGDVVRQKKPASDVYDWVLKRLELAPAACLALEDSANGLAASLGAGIATLVTVSEYTRGQNFSGAAVVLSDFGEPTAPFVLLAGDADGSGFVDVKSLRFWHRRSLVTSYAGNKKQ
jgi:HAD superfamily hydrolase (TIGR01509 family)